MKKGIVVLLSLAISIPVTASPQVYEDDFISFEYDNESDITVRKAIGTDYLSYVLLLKNDDENRSVGVRFNDDQNYIDTFMDPYEESTTVYEPISSEDMTRRFSYESNGHRYSYTQKLLYVDGSKSVTIAFPDSINDGSVESKTCIAFADSVKILNFDAIPELPENKKENGFLAETIFEKKMYSDQAMKYAQKALDTCNQWFDMDITGKEAAEIFFDIERRTSSYTGDDKDLYWAVFNKDYYFKYGTDEDVAEIKNKLQEIVGVNE